MKNQQFLDDIMNLSAEPARVLALTPKLVAAINRVIETAPNERDVEHDEPFHRAVVALLAEIRREARTPGGSDS